MHLNTRAETAFRGLFVPMLPTLRYVLSVWMLLGAVLTGSMSVSFFGDPENVDGAVPLMLFCVFFLYLAWRSWSTGAVVADDEVTFRGAWRSSVVKRGAVADVRAEPLVASIARRLLGGQLLLTHEIVVQIDAGTPSLRLGRLGFAFASEAGAGQFVERLRSALRSHPTPESTI